MTQRHQNEMPKLNVDYLFRIPTRLGNILVGFAGKDRLTIWGKESQGNESELAALIGETPAQQYHMIAAPDRIINVGQKFSGTAEWLYSQNIEIQARNIPKNPNLECLLGAIPFYNVVKTWRHVNRSIAFHRQAMEFSYALLQYGIRNGFVDRDYISGGNEK